MVAIWRNRTGNVKSGVKRASNTIKAWVKQTKRPQDSPMKRVRFLRGAGDGCRTVLVEKTDRLHRKQRGGTLRA